MIPAKVRGSGTAMQGMEEGVQSFPHLEAQHGAAKTWPPISTCLDIIFQRRSVGLGSLCVSR